VGCTNNKKFIAFQNELLKDFADNLEVVISDWFIYNKRHKKVVYFIKLSSMMADSLNRDGNSNSLKQKHNNSI
jgi:hypothetical protein